MSAAREINSLMQISSEAVSRASALAIKAFGEEAEQAIDFINKDLYKRALISQFSELKSLPNSSAFTVISCLDPLLAESVFECEPDELFIRPHNPAPVDPVCVKFVNTMTKKAINTKQELYGEIIEGAPSQQVNAQDLWNQRETKLDEECEEMKKL